MVAPIAAGPAPARDLLFVTTPALWPAWPFLPVVRRTGGAEALGVLFDARAVCGLGGHAHTVFRVNLFDLPPTVGGLLALPRDEYGSADALVRDGWRVD